MSVLSSARPPESRSTQTSAKDLLRAFREGDPAAAADFREWHPGQMGLGTRIRLADAQRVLARKLSGVELAAARAKSVDLVNAIWDDDLDAVTRLVRSNPTLVHDQALIRSDSNWGPPMTYAANLGRDRIIRALRDLGATDLGSAMERATLQGKVSTAALLHRMLGSPAPPASALGGAASTLSVSGTAFLFEIGARAIRWVTMPARLAPVYVRPSGRCAQPGRQARRFSGDLRRHRSCCCRTRRPWPFSRGRLDRRSRDRPGAATRGCSVLVSHTGTFIRPRWAVAIP